LSTASIDWRRSSRRWEDRAKAKAIEIDDLRARLAGAEADAAEARTELARYVIAAQHSIPVELLANLTTEEEMRAYAPRIAAWRAEGRRSGQRGRP
jgi:hypothetical protein